MSRYSGPQQYGSPAIVSSLLETQPGKTSEECELGCVSNAECKSWSIQGDVCNTFSSTIGSPLNLQSDDYVSANVLDGASAVKYFETETVGHAQGTEISPAPSGLTKRGCSVKCVNMDNCVGWSYDTGSLAKYDNSNCSIYSSVSGIDDTKTEFATFIMSDYTMAGNELTPPDSTAPADSTDPVVGSGTDPVVDAGTADAIVDAGTDTVVDVDQQAAENGGIMSDTEDWLSDIKDWIWGVEWDKIAVGVVLLMMFVTAFWYVFIRTNRRRVRIPRRIEIY